MKKLKKFLVVLAYVITVVCLAVGFAGCSDNVDGTTYQFSKVSFQYGDYSTDGFMSEIEQWYSSGLEGITISFADGMATITQDEQSYSIEYTQNGSSIIINGVTYTVSGDELVAKQSLDDITIIFTFKKV